MKITGIMPCYNLISGQYPFAESVLLALPLVDELIINDGGSTDGTYETLLKMSSLNPKIKILRTQHKAGTHWDSIDEGVELMIQQAQGDWIIEIQADEYYLPKDHQKIFDLITFCEENEYSSIRQVSITITCLENADTYRYRNLRIFKNLPNIRSRDGGDSFFVEGQDFVREGFSSHNMPRELDTELEMYNLSSSFLHCMLVRGYRHYKFYAKGTKDREPGFLHALAVFNIQDPDNIDFDAIPKRSIIETFPNFNPHPNLHRVHIGLAEMGEYRVREEILRRIQEEDINE